MKQQNPSFIYASSQPRLALAWQVLTLQELGL